MASLLGELGNLGGEEGGDKDKEEEEARLIEEARQQQEEERKARHAKMEAEREEERQRIRDKYGLKKKVAEEVPEPDDSGRIGARKKKSPAELQAEREQAENEEEEGFLDTVKGYVAPFAEKLGFDIFK